MWQPAEEVGGWETECARQRVEAYPSTLEGAMGVEVGGVETWDGGRGAWDSGTLGASWDSWT